MSISRCPTCDRLIDEDYEVEHYEECKAENERLDNLKIQKENYGKINDNN